MHTYTLQGTDEDSILLDNPNLRVEPDKILESKAIISTSDSTETTSWGIDEVLESTSFWDTLPAPSGNIKVCIVGSGYDLDHPDLPKEPDVVGTDSSIIHEAWSTDIVGTGTHSAGIIAAVGNTEGVSSLK